jgi:hypothetical protein
MQTPLWFWVAFNACVLVVLTLDLFGFQRRPHAPTLGVIALVLLVAVGLSLFVNRAPNAMRLDLHQTERRSAIKSSNPL